jgi:hypothetical protein
VTGGPGHTVRLALHLGPEVDVRLVGGTAELCWPGDAGDEKAVLHLPEQLRWTAHRGETDPVLGWYSPRFGERVPATTLVGSGALEHSLELRTTLDFTPEQPQPTRGGPMNG